MNQQVVPAGEAYTPDPVEFAKDRVPVFEGPNGEDKTRYLTYRVFDFGKGDAAGLAHLNLKTINKWRAQDAEFRDWEDYELPKIREGLQIKFTVSQFYRNMWLALGLDAKVFSKAALEGLEKLSKDELEYLMRTRGRYTTDALVNMLRVASGDIASKAAGTININTIFISGPRGPDDNSGDGNRDGSGGSPTIIDIPGGD